jgi:uncharacterized cupredoxin-like copper-binding protein
MKRLGIVLVVATLLVGIGSLIRTAPAAESGATATTVRVRLDEFKVILAVKTARAGSVTFVVRNVGRLMHEFVVLRTKLAPSKLPVRRSRAKEIGRVGKIPPFAPDKTRRLTVKLTLGKYVLLCNLPAHYRAGQFAGFRARQP